MVTHTRVEVIPESVRRLSATHFASSVRVELSLGSITQHDITFRAPVSCIDVKAARYGLFFDSFQFRDSGPRAESFPCNLSFLLHHAENCPLIPLRVNYIGIAKAEKREAQDRLGKGHDKLQKLLAEQSSRQSMQTTSIVLYRPTPLDPPVLQFPDVIETIEATMIQFFKPTPLNVERLNFPRDSPTLVAKLKGIGVSAIFTEVDAPKGAELFSDSISGANQHNIEIIL